MLNRSSGTAGGGLLMPLRTRLCSEQYAVEFRNALRVRDRAAVAAIVGIGVAVVAFFTAIDDAVPANRGLDLACRRTAIAADGIAVVAGLGDLNDTVSASYSDSQALEQPSPLVVRPSSHSLGWLKYAVATGLRYAEKVACKLMALSREFRFRRWRRRPGCRGSR